MWSKKGLRSVVVGLAVCALALVVFHKPLLIAVCRHVLNQVPSLCYTSIGFKGSTLVLEGLSARSNTTCFRADCLELHLGVDWSQFCLRPRIDLIHPEMTLMSPLSSSESSMPLFYFSRWVVPVWNVQGGVLIAGSSRFYGSLESSDTASQFSLAYEPGTEAAPLIEGRLERTQSHWKMTFLLEEAHLQRLSPLWGAWGEIGGQIVMRGDLEVDLTGHVHAVHLSGYAEELAFRSFYCNRAEFSIDCDSPQAGIEALTTHIHVRDAGGELNQGLRLRGLNGQISKTPDRPLCLQLTGAGVYEGKSLQFSLKGEEQARLEMNWAGHTLLGSVAFSQQESVFQAAFEGHLNADEICCTAYFQGFAFQEATVRVPYLRAARYAASFPGCVLSGGLSLEAFISQEEIAFTLHPHQFACQFDLFEWACAAEGSAIQGIYVPSRRRLSCTVPLAHSLLTHRPSHKVAQIGSGCVQIEYEALMEPHWEVKALLSHVNGQMLEPLSQGSCVVSVDSTSHRVCIERAEATLALLDGEELHIEATPIRWDFHAQEGCFCLKLAQKKKEFACLEADLKCKQGSLIEMTLNPRSSHVLGTLLQCHYLALDVSTGHLALDMRPQIRAQDVAKILCFLQQTRLLSSPLDTRKIERMHLQGALDLCITSEHLQEGLCLDLVGREFKAYQHSYPHLSAHIKKSPGLWQIDALQLGPLFLQATVESSDELFSSSNLQGRWNEASFKASGAFHPATQTLSCQVDALSLDLGHFKEELKGQLLSSFSVRGDFSNETLPWTLEGEGSLYVDLNAPVALSASTKHKILYTYTPERGLQTEQIAMRIKTSSAAAFSVIRVSSVKIVPGGAIDLGSLELSVSPPLLELLCAPTVCRDIRFEGDLKVEATARRENGFWELEGRLQPGCYGFKDHLFPCEQFQFLYHRGACSLRAKTSLGNNPIWGSLQCNLSAQPYGVLKLCDHPKAEGLRVTFSSDPTGLLLESCEGSCHGLTCKLTKSRRRKISLASVLTGSIQCDLSQFLPLCSAAIQKKMAPFKLGKGYTWEGDIVLWQELQRGFLITGTVQGRECALLGYQLAQFDASMEATETQLMLSHVKIADPAGRICIKKVECKKDSEARWNLAIPQLLIEQLQPSSLRKIGLDPGIVKPFVIERFALSSIRGQLDDLSSLQGEGALLFSNQFKKESSVFDFPLELVKRLGLDLGLLTPVCGSIQVELRGDRLYLLSLEQAYSDKERSSFYLAPGKQLSYIDLSGAVHIDLKMQQDVFLKIIEPFTLTIRGTLDKPRYGIRP